MAKKLEVLRVVSDEGNEAYTNDEYVPDNYFVEVSLDVSGLPKDADEDEIDEFYCDFDCGEQVGTIEGMIMLGRAAKEHDMDMYIMADDYDMHAEYFARTLMDAEDTSLQELLYTNILVIEEYDVNLTKTDHKRLIKKMKDMIFRTYHIVIDLILAFPEPIPYEKSEIAKLNEELALSIAGRSKESQKDVEFILNDIQLDYLMGRLNSDDFYPEEVKDKKVWSILEGVGFKEIDESRILILKVEGND